MRIANLAIEFAFPAAVSEETDVFFSKLLVPTCKLLGYAYEKLQEIEAEKSAQNEKSAEKEVPAENKDKPQDEEQKKAEKENGQ